MTNEKRLAEMVEAVMKEMFKEPKTRTQREFQLLQKHHIRTALTPFCMEMTDEEIKEYAHSTVCGVCSDILQSANVSGIIQGAKFYRDRDKK